MSEELVFRPVVEFEFVDSAGNSLQLAPGQTALITLPLYIARDENNVSLSAGDMFDSYSLDEATGQ
ncbi:MAG: hypothetical protein HKN50_01395 [Gammaproteobacteria bacterium]|nr:hypothetical protein [Gammaproteobacteria bacterium]